MLIDAEELAAHLHDPEWTVFDCRHDLADFSKGERLYRAGHIPGAFFANVETDLSGPKTGANGRHPLPSPAAFASFLSRHGVTDRSTLVAYDDAGGMYAARLWWLARWVGLRRTLVLDGGFPRWMAAGKPVSTAIPSPRAGGFRVSVDDGMAWGAREVESHLRDDAVLLVDARTAERHRGEKEPIDPVAGRIPGSANRFFKENLNSDGTFRPSGALAKEFGALIAGRAPANIVHYCGSGVAACANAFAMEYAGIPGSRIYSGSWSEWIANPAHPVARGP